MSAPVPSCQSDNSPLPRASRVPATLPHPLDFTFLLTCHPQNSHESWASVPSSFHRGGNGHPGRLNNPLRVPEPAGRGPELSPGPGSPRLPLLPHLSAPESCENWESYSRSPSLTPVTEFQVLIQGMDDPGRYSVIGQVSALHLPFSVFFLLEPIPTCPLPSLAPLICDPGINH